MVESLHQRFSNGATQIRQYFQRQNEEQKKPSDEELEGYRTGWCEEIGKLDQDLVVYNIIRSTKGQLVGDVEDLKKQLQCQYNGEHGISQFVSDTAINAH